MVIQHNMTAENAVRHSGILNKKGNTPLERLSSGYRVNHASDDAANLSVSEQMRGQIRGLNQASRNSTDGQSVANIADGALNEVSNVLNRARELCIQAANDTNVTADREAIQMELDALTEEVDRICKETEFNTMKLFQGDPDDGLQMNIQTGANSQQLTKLTIPRMDADVLEMRTTRKLEVYDSIAAGKSAEDIDDMLDMVNDCRNILGAFYNRMEHASSTADISSENVQGSESQIRDTNMAHEMMDFSRNNILKTANESMISQANSSLDGTLQLLQ